MKTWITTLVALLGLGIAGASVRADDARDGEIVLFDGTSMDGWEHEGDGSFELEDGLLRTEGGMGLLWYTKQTFGDCVIHVEYRARSGRDNSGVFIRIADKPDDAWFAVHNGYEVQICDTADPLHRTGAVYSLSKAEKDPTQPSAWNTMEITLKGEVVHVDVNGVRVTDFDPTGPVPERRVYYEPERGPRPTSGYIGLQNHGANDVVFFRKVAVRPLSDK